MTKVAVILNAAPEDNEQQEVIDILRRLWAGANVDAFTYSSLLARIRTAVPWPPTPRRRRPMTDDLKPCPFCGTVPHVHDEGENRDMGFRYSIYCPKCDNSVAQAEADELNWAIAAWNTRPEEDALRARIAELEAQWASVPWHSIADLLWAIDNREPGAMALKLFYDAHAGGDHD